MRKVSTVSIQNNPHHKVFLRLLLMELSDLDSPTLSNASTMDVHLFCTSLFPGLVNFCLHRKTKHSQALIYLFVCLFIYLRNSEIIVDLLADLLTIAQKSYYYISSNVSGILLLISNIAKISDCGSKLKTMYTGLLNVVSPYS